MTLGTIGDHTKADVPSERRVLVRRDLDGFLLNNDGVVVPTVHQYDCFITFFKPMLLEWLKSARRRHWRRSSYARWASRGKVFIGWYDKCSLCSAGISGCYAPHKRFEDDGKLELTVSAEQLCHGVAVSEEKKTTRRSSWSGTNARISVVQGELRGREGWQAHPQVVGAVARAQ